MELSLMEEIFAACAKDKRTTHKINTTENDWGLGELPKKYYHIMGVIAPVLCLLRLRKMKRELAS